MLQLRRLVPALARNGGSLRGLSTTPALLQGEQPKKEDDKKDDVEGFELLPPGCSMIDPAYGVSVSDPQVYYYDSPSRSTSRPRKAVPQTPTSLAAAKQKLQDQKDAKGGKDEEEPYVYLPPGSSMREPGYNSMSDPQGGRVYYRDPIPVMRKK